MYWAFKQLAVPTNYLRIRHGSDILHSKAVYDWILPIGLSLTTMLVFKIIGTAFSIFSNGELIKRILDLLALMIVFYMAALAAVATFERKGIDSPLPDDDALITVRDPATGLKADRPLSYRQFICYCFGYLSFLSLCLYMFMTIIAFVWEDFAKIFSCSLMRSSILIYIIQPMLFFVTFFFIWQLMVTSLLGIYFLTERIQSLKKDD